LLLRMLLLRMLVRLPFPGSAVALSVAILLITPIPKGTLLVEDAALCVVVCCYGYELGSGSGACFLQATALRVSLTAP